MRGHRCSKLISQWEKVAKCNLRANLKYMKNVLSNEITVFCNAEDRFSWVWAFLQKKSFWSLNAQNHFFRASKNTNSVFSVTKQLWECEGPDVKNFFLSEKKLLNAILRAKLKYMKMFLSNEWTVFLQCRRQIFMSFELFCREKSF